MDVYESLKRDPDVRKELEKAAGWILPLWMSGAHNEHYHKQLILNFAEKLNPIWFATSGHPILQLRLLAACGLRRSTVKHKFYKSTGGKYGSSLMGLITYLHPDINPEEVDMWIRLNDEADVKETAQMCGFQAKEVKEILADFRRVKR